MVGSTIAHYRILEKLGQGGMGEVYRAQDTRLQRDVALKVLPLKTVDDPAARQQLLREARTASVLSHPHICAVFDAGEDGAQIYIALELVRGKPLTDLIPPGGMATETVARYGAQIADALAFAHEEGIVHRDLKSANVMVAAGRAKILDFGLAIRTRQAATASTVTTAEDHPSAGGTLAYMAPEVLLGAPADSSSDIWALGTVLYEMTTGRRPFGGRTGYELTSSILRDNPDPMPPHVPAALRTGILRCLAKEPAQRYRTAGEVRAVLEAMSAGEHSADVPLVQPGRNAARRKVLAFAGAGIVLIGLIAAVAVLKTGSNGSRPAGAASPPRITSVAVLPLENLSRDSEQEYFADGITEALIANLAQIRALKVISRTSVMRFKGSAGSGKSLPQIAQELGVDAVVEGSVQRGGNRVRITAQLIHAATDSHLWAGTFERDMSDALRIQSEIATAIANEIRVNVTPGERARLHVARSENPEAQEAYLRGRYHMRRLNEGDLSKAIQYFERAIEIDPANAQAYAGLAQAWIERGVWGGRSFREVEKHARTAAERALQLDPAVADARTALAHIRYIYDWDWTGSEAEFRQAVDIDPNSAEAHFYFAVMLHAMGEMDRAIAEIERARERDPVSASVESTYGRILYRARRHGEALQHLERARDLDQGEYGVYARMADVHESLRDYPRALELFQKSEALAAAARATGSAPARYSPGQARLLALMGRRPEALSVLKGVLEQPAERQNAWAIATVYAALNDKDQAFAWLNKAIDQKGLVVFTKTEPKFDSLHSDPRWAATLRRINLTP